MIIKKRLLLFFFLFSNILIAQSDRNQLVRNQVLSIIQNARKPYHPDYNINKDLSDVEIIDSIYEKVINDTAWYNEIAISYMAIGEYDKSLKIFHILADNNIHASNKWYNMACIYSLRNDINKSAYYFEKALQLSDDGLLSKQEYNWLFKDNDLINLRRSSSFKQLKEFYLSRKDQKAANLLYSTLEDEFNYKGDRSSRFLNKIAKKYLKVVGLEKKSNYVNKYTVEFALSSASALYLEDGNTEKSELIYKELKNFGSDLRLFYEAAAFSYQAKNDTVKLKLSIDSLIVATKRISSSKKLASAYALAADYYYDDIKNYKKAVFYKEQSFYTDPSKVNFNDEETIQWIGYIFAQRQFDYLELYKFSEYLFNIGKIKNDYVNLLKLKINDLIEMTWSDKEYANKEIMKLIPEFESLPENVYSKYDLLDLYDRVYFAMDNVEYETIIQDKALELSQSKNKFPFYHYFFLYRKSMRLEDWDNALKQINKIFHINKQVNNPYPYEVALDFAKINIMLNNFKIGEETIKEILPDLMQEQSILAFDAFDELIGIYSVNNDSTMIREYEEKIVDYIEDTKSDISSFRHVREKNDYFLSIFENLAATHLLYNFEDYHPYNSMKYLEKGKYRYLKSKLNEKSSIYYFPEKVDIDIFGFEQVMKSDHYSNTQGDLDFNRIYYYFYVEDILQIGITSFGLEDSKYLPLYELSSYADSVYKSYSDLRYNITKDKSSKSSLLLNFINYINQPDKFNDQLMFIVDPILQFIPFEALIDSNGKYLIENIEISYTFSTTIHSILKKRDYNAENSNLLAFANPTIKPKNDSSSLRGLVDDVLLNKDIERFNISNIHSSLGYSEWPKLFNAEKEVLNIKKLNSNTDILIGNDASEEKLFELSKNGDLKKYNIIHFATHALSIPEVPDVSSIILSSGSNDKFDGYLTPKEISKLDLNADFVNLSACQTALGKTYDSEGIIGFSQSFIEAGANGVLASLWNVNDESTSIFMTSFYSHYFKYKNVPKALALTKREFINGDYGDEYRKPFYWAPYIYYGI